MSSTPPNMTFFRIMAKRHREIEEALATWDAAWVAANWSSPQMPLEQWRKAIMESTAGQCALLENVIEYMPVWGFIKWFLPENFRRLWPHIRVFCPKRLFDHRGKFDLYWSLLETGSGRVPPLPEWFDLSAGERAFLRKILRAEGRTREQTLALVDGNAEASLEKLVRQGFLFTDKGRVWRNAAYHTTQAPRPPQTRTFLVKGRKRMFHAPQSW